ncbi:MAG TPA: VC0807 family protein [Caulobacteraceae bacterium]|jgi:hypothetical protein
MAGGPGKLRAFLTDRGPMFALEIGVNLVLPLMIYDALRVRLGDVHALMASSAPPIGWSIFEFIRARRVDAVSIIVLIGIALSLLAYIGGGGIKFLQLREKLTTALVGAGFIVSVIVRRPLIYVFFRATMRRHNQTEDLVEFEGLRDTPAFRRILNNMTLAWGAALLADAALGVVFVMTLSVHDYLIAGPLLGYATMGVLTGWTFWYLGRARERGRCARREAETTRTDAGAGAEAIGGPFKEPAE